MYVVQPVYTNRRSRRVDALSVACVNAHRAHARTHNGYVREPYAITRHLSERACAMRVRVCAYHLHEMVQRGFDPRPGRAILRRCRESSGVRWPIRLNMLHVPICSARTILNDAYRRVRLRFVVVAAAAGVRHAREECTPVLDIIRSERRRALRVYYVHTSISITMATPRASAPDNYSA